MLPYTRPVPYCLLLASLGASIVGITLGAPAALILHKMDSTWFREVCPSSNPILRLSDVNERCDVGIGSNGLKASHLDHDDLPLFPVLYHRDFDVVVHNWWVSSAPILPNFGTRAKTVNPRPFQTGLVVAAANSEIPVVKYGLGLFGLPQVVGTAVGIWLVCFRPGAVGRLLEYLTRSTE